MAADDAHPIRERTNEDGVAFVGVIAWSVPALRPALKDHLEELEGMVLPHVLMAAFEREAERLLRSDPASVLHLLDLLESAATDPSQDVREMIQVSFVEGLPYADEPGADLRELLGPQLRQWLTH